jgi:cytochrome b involved in lipid metabolism
MVELDEETKKVYAFGFRSYPDVRDQQVMPKTHDWLMLKQHVDQVHYQAPEQQANKKNPHDQVLWRIHDKLYDLTKFQHPGGQAWIEMTRNTDITELFETSHIHIEKARQLLDKYYVRDASHPRYSAFLTFQPKGFYDTLRKRVATTLAASTTAKTSHRIHDFLLIAYLFFQTIMILWPFSSNTNQGSLGGWILIALSGSCLALLAICAHNYFHLKDNWRMYSFDLAGVSSYEWRITHAYSHHNFPNSVMDYEVQAFEGVMINFLPYRNKKSIFSKVLTLIFVILGPCLATLIGVS